jgi:signal transduction histidine kinase
MDRRRESGPPGRTAAARQGEVDADARAREQAAPSVSAVSGPASRDTAATDGAERRVVGGIDSDREGGRFRVRLFVPSWRRRTTREVLAAVDAERERIAQDLHDGVQQRLTALRIGLSLAADRFGERGETEASAVLQGFGDDVDHLIDEVRDLAHGIYPTLLTFFGLAAAMVSAGVQSGQPVTVQASGVRRCRPEVEIAVYFSCLAALDNAAKHAGPVPVSVDLSDTGGALHFAVCDSGAGFDPAETQVGAGIANMRDRIAAVGGTLAVDSAPGRGTRVHGSVPDPGWR